MLYYYIMGGIIVLLLIKVIFDIVKINNLKNINLTLLKKVNDLSEEFDSEKDFKYLHQIATFEMNSCVETELIMINDQRPELLKDKDLNEFVSIVCKAALEKLSDIYKNKLIIRYFGKEDKLIKYLTEYIYNVGMKLFSKMNQAKIKKIKRAEKTEEVLKGNEPIKKASDL